MYLKFSAHAYFRTRNSNLKSVSNKNQLEISRNLIRDNRIANAALFVLNGFNFLTKFNVTWIIINYITTIYNSGDNKIHTCLTSIGTLRENNIDTGSLVILSNLSPLLSENLEKKINRRGRFIF